MLAEVLHVLRGDVYEKIYAQARELNLGAAGRMLTARTGSLNSYAESIYACEGGCELETATFNRFDDNSGASSSAMFCDIGGFTYIGRVRREDTI